jgi:glutamyl-tRNA synthetase
VSIFAHLQKIKTTIISQKGIMTMDYNKLAAMLFPHIDKTPADYETIYPPRQLPEGAKVTRLGPSPTGFIHLGNLYGAFVDERLARQSDGIFYLRIEDTDDKRYVEGAVETIITSLDFFGIDFDEGVTLEGAKGDYGPYYQSQRGEIYQCYVKDLMKQGLAYPCFMTAEEIQEIRDGQEANKQTPGIYGEFAVSRNLTMEEIEAYLETREHTDKAGAYGIQGRFGIFIEEIRGEYNTIVGLPIARVYHELVRFNEAF